ncbi:hypothetical protein E8E13_009056 [Curvularia kusanoi]|uniref:Xylanolytic transcriptional activator regulatory domain-containing protein n=1 Tax=Curvularia kusanoi TaxID=90978 RepID=A0A9P4TPW4_CURKU|nr:hypothetical protein E8E13_009056 [Curvularia kusanoi]
MAGMLFSKVHGLDPWVTSLFEGQNTIPDIHISEDEIEATNTSVEALTERWRSSSLLKQIEQALSAETNEDEEGTDSVKVFDRKALQLSMLATKTLRTKASSGQAYSNVISVMPPGPSMSSVGLTDECTNHSQFPLPAYGSIDPSLDADITTVEANDIEADVIIGSATNTPEDMNLPVNWRSDLDNYFATSHCWLPISQKHDLLRIAYILSSFSTSQNTPIPVTHGDRTFLKAVLAFAALQSETRLASRTPGTDNLYSKRASEVCGVIGTLIPNNMEAIEIGHVRALLIVTLVYMHSGTQNQAWFSIGRAARAMSILLKPFLRQEKSSRDLEEGIRRTALCCIALDSLVAAWVGLRPYFNRADILCIGSLPTEGLEEWEPWISSNVPEGAALAATSPGQILSTFNHFMEYIGLLNELLRSSKGTLKDIHSQSSELSIMESAKRLNFNLNDQTFSSNPQRFNCILLAASLREVMKPSRDPNLDARDTTDHLWHTVRVAENFVQTVGVPFVSPACNVFISVLRLSQNDRSGPQCGFENEITSLRDCLLELDQSVTTVDVEQHRLQQRISSTPFPLRERSLMTEAERLLRNLDGIETVTGTQSDDLEFVHGTESHVLSGSNAPTTIGNGLVQNAVGSNIEPQTTEQTIEPSAIGIVLSDDNLFQSLAELDPDDWTANMPEFMKHLGVMNESDVGMDKFYGAS